MRRIALSLLLLAGPTVPAVAGGQNALDAARAQYEAAAYEEALATLTRVTDASAPTSRVEVEQYRALCLIALGHMADAERAVAALVEADPVYVPSSSVASPRVLSLVADLRKKELPNAARRLMEAGRVAYEAKDLGRAQQQFDLLLKLLDDPAMAGRPERDDLRTLANGFATLTAAVAAPAPPPTTPETQGSSTPPPRVASATNGNASSTPSPDSGSSPAAAAGSQPPPDVYIPAVAIEQVLPPWDPPTPTIGRFEYNGQLRVRIGADGSVTSVTVDDASHPAYDGRLLQVAPSWRFKPALRNGIAVESERLIAIQLRPEV